MRKIFAAILAILLCFFPFYTHAFMGAVKMGVVGGGVCTETTPYNVTTQDSYQRLGYDLSYTYANSPFVPANSGTIKVVKLNLLKTGSPTFIISVRLCTTTNGTTQVGTCTVVGTIDSSTLTGSYVSTTAVHVADYNVTASTTYHIVATATTLGDSSNYVRWGVATSGGLGVYSDSDGSGTWNTGDADASVDATLLNCE